MNMYFYFKKEVGSFSFIYRLVVFKVYGPLPQSRVRALGTYGRLACFTNLY